ncbi:MAG: S41 family peptidase [Lamprobacter sp.]|uniref:S41 family peptidase n=1 Tax=Lamprobacter sp. TaxID=3100796 RepID=UPI002B25ECBB|nr:S41 family peptidase [Lamprobacter sp.]MEA3638362.1 S41 family peptidase [Lamprobacter sp.]
MPESEVQSPAERDTGSEPIIQPPPPGFKPTGTRPEPSVEEVRQRIQAAAEASEEEEPEGLPLDELRIFAEVFGRIKSDYVERVEDRELLSSAIRGMLAGLDPHSAYLDPDQYDDLQVGTTGEFGGLGIEVGMEDGFVKVIAPMDDTPAQRAGIQAGDLIVRIDEKPVKGMSLSDAVELMRGKPGSAIELTLMRDGESAPLRVRLERAVIKVASVKQRLLEPGYGYLRIANFQARTTDDLLAAVKTLKRENEGPLKGVVLDLRNNPGGVLNTAVGVSDAFLEEGLIVYTKGRLEDAKLEFHAGPDDVLDGAPLVVLVNGGSASASEIVAGALQDQRRALIMGNETFGKGSVQTIIPVDERTALKLTTARYYTPAGRSIQALGIVPDIILERGSLTLTSDPDLSPLKEANLIRHLEDQDGNAIEPAIEIQMDATDEGDEEKTGKKTEETAKDKPLAARDYQLSEALNVLKGLVILGQAPAVAERPQAEDKADTVPAAEVPAAEEPAEAAPAAEASTEEMPAEEAPAEAPAAEMPAEEASEKPAEEAVD